MVRLWLFFGTVVLLTVPIMMVFVFVTSNRTQKQKMAELRKLPTLDEYLAQNPKGKTEQGPACNQCNTTTLINRGLSSSVSKQRILTCDNCNATLFRAES